jgi:hypothetical protein
MDFRKETVSWYNRGIPYFGVAMTIDMSPWPVPVEASPRALGQYWFHALFAETPAHLMALMQKSGIPKGVNPDTGEALVNAVFHRHFVRPDAAILALPVTEPRSRVSVEKMRLGQLDWEHLSAFEAVPAALVVTNDNGPLHPVTVVDTPFTHLESCLHAGFDCLASYFFHHTDAPEAKVWQGWVSLYGAGGGNKGHRLPWLHFLAQTTRTSLLDVMVNLPGVDINQKDRVGRSPLFYARSTAAVEILVDAGADITLKGKDGQDVLSTWASLGVSAGVRDAMEARLGADQSGFDQDAIFVRGFSRSVVEHMTAGFGHYTHPGGQFQGLETDRENLKSVVFDHAINGKVHPLLAVDLFALGFFEAKQATEHKALQSTYHSGPSYSSNSNAWLPAINGLSALAPGAGILPPQTSGFPAAMFVRHLLASSREEVKNAWGGTEVAKGWTPTPEVQGFLDAWEGSLGTTPEEKLVSMGILLDEWSSVFHRTGPVTRLAVDAEFGQRINALPKGTLAALWANTSGLDPVRHALFWDKTLRNPVLAPILLERLIGESVKVWGRVPHDGEQVTPEQVAALYSALTTRWVLLSGKKEWALNGAEKKEKPLITKSLEDWTSNGVEWRANAEDYKWARDKRLQNLDFGRLEKKVAFVDPSPAPARRRL